MFKKSAKSMEGLIQHVQVYFTSFLFHVPSGGVGNALQNHYIGTGPLNDARSNPATDFFTFHFLFELIMPFSLISKINIFVVILM